MGGGREVEKAKASEQINKYKRLRSESKRGRKEEMRLR